MSQNEQVWCDQGHPPHDPATGCGPCADEQAAGLGQRPDATGRQ